MATLQQWVAGARLRTLAAAFSPIIIACAVVVSLDSFSYLRALLCFLVALFLQVGVNYANDYSDGVRGTDEVRAGPLRLTGSKLVAANKVKWVAFFCFACALFFGLVLTIVSQQWVMIGLGVVCVVAAWYYTGGSKPYGYLGFGEVAVFVFFGLVATLATVYVMAGTVSFVAVVGACGSGFFACALLMANNIRDIPTDSVVGKRTLAVRLGEVKARWCYVGMVLLPFLFILTILSYSFWLFLVFLVLPFTFAPISLVLRKATGVAMIPVLQQTSVVNVLYAIVFAIAILV